MTGGTAIVLNGNIEDELFLKKGAVSQNSFYKETAFKFRLFISNGLGATGK